MQRQSRLTSVMRYPIDALEFGTEWKHGAEDFADRGEIVVGDPAAQAQELLVENGRGSSTLRRCLGDDRRLAVVKFDDDAGHALLAKWDQDASADYGRGARGDTVGEDHVERYREGDVAEFGHQVVGSV